MECPRCRGWIVEEQVVTRQGRIGMLRCLFCGELTDRVVMANRRRREGIPRGNSHRREVEKRRTSRSPPHRRKPR